MCALSSTSGCFVNMLAWQSRLGEESLLGDASTILRLVLIAMASMRVKGGAQPHLLTANDVVAKFDLKPHWPIQPIEGLVLHPGQQGLEDKATWNRQLG